MVSSNYRKEDTVLENLDLSILYFCNRNLVNPVFDFLFVIFSNNITFLLLVAVFVILFLFKSGVKAKLAIIISLVCIAIVDPSCYYILKNLFSRLRPCHTLDDLRMIVGCGGLYGFPSNHAANSFAIAMVLSVFYRGYTAVFATLAFLIGFSRIYLGKHYPSDILAGAVWGIVIALLVIYLTHKILSKTSARKHLEEYGDEIQETLRWKKNQKY